VASASSPTVIRRQLAAFLANLRAQSGKTLEQVAAELEWSAAKVSRIEHAQTGVMPRDMRHLLRVYGVDLDGTDGQRMIALATESRKPGWWQSYRDVLPDWFQPYLGLEAAASSINEYAPELVPGLLQTDDYYRAYMLAAPAAADADEIERKLAVRRQRQARVTAGGGPEVWAVLNEAVTLREVGSPDVMRGQFTHLLELGGHPNITVQVLQFKSGAHPAMDGGFITLGFPAQENNDVVYLENQTSSAILETAQEVDRYRAMFARLVAAALGPAESRSMIAEAANRVG
jgi:transcriptional regulator with XRE-family HTH domain